jgi:hypothetical protein
MIYPLTADIVGRLSFAAAVIDRSGAEYEKRAGQPSIIDDNHVGSAPKTPEPLKDSATLGFGPVPDCCVQYDGH